MCVAIKPNVLYFDTMARRPEYNRGRSPFEVFTRPSKKERPPPTQPVFLRLTVPRFGNDFLRLLHLLELPRPPLLVPLVLVWMVLPHQRLELLLQPGALDLLRPLIEVDGELEYLGVIPLRRPPVGVACVLVEPLVLLAPVPHLLLVHRLLQLVVQLPLLLGAFPVVLGDEVERLPKIGDSLVVVHVEQERFPAGEVGLLSHRVRHHQGVVVVRRRPQLHSRVAVVQRLLVLSHPAQYGALLQLDATAEQRRVNVQTPHRREAVVHEPRRDAVVPLLDLFLRLVQELDHLLQPAVLLPGPVLLRIELENVLVEGYGVLGQAELHGCVGAEGGGHHLGIVVGPRVVVGRLGYQFAGHGHGQLVIAHHLVTSRLHEQDLDSLVREGDFSDEVESFGPVSALGPGRHEGSQGRVDAPGDLRVGSLGHGPVRADGRLAVAAGGQRQLQPPAERDEVRLVLLLPLLRLGHGLPLRLSSRFELGLLLGLPPLPLPLAPDATERPPERPFAPLDEVDLDSRLQQSADEVGPRGVVHVLLPHLLGALPQLPRAARPLLLARGAVRHVLGRCVVRRPLLDGFDQFSGDVQHHLRRNGFVRVPIRVSFRESEGADGGVLPFVDVRPPPLRLRALLVAASSAGCDAILHHVGGVGLALARRGPLRAPLFLVPFPAPTRQVDQDGRHDDFARGCVVVGGGGRDDEEGEEERDGGRRQEEEGRRRGSAAAAAADGGCISGLSHDERWSGFGSESDRRP
mmetsp:Transcript_33440/g.71278  ORF Transcript_33440/g.71278 Transcript_33440/m.71278 type:complete len:745 (-) Transcript_33440:72-2306(-)